MQNKKICVLGSVIVDMTAQAPYHPAEGETVIGTSFAIRPGGKGSNQAIAAKRAGGDVTMITKVGKDALSDLITQTYRSENMSAGHVLVDETLSTGVALITVNDAGANRITVVPAACQNITRQEVEALTPVIAGSGILLVQLESNLDATVQAAGIAHSSGNTVILNTAPACEIPEELFALADIVTPNEVEAERYSGVAVDSLENCRTAAKWFFARGVKKVIITWGDKGVYACDGQQELLVSPLKVKAVDTTGAGDTFNGAFAAALAEGKDFFDAVRFGNAAAGLSVTRFGAALSAPHRQEILDALA